MEESALIEAGWDKRELGGFTGLAGPFWLRGEGIDREVGLLVEPKHCNNHLGTIHGGLVSTFADIGLGIGVSGAIGGTHCVTLQLQLYFVSTARVGEFVQVKPELVRQTKQIVFVRGLIRTGERTIANADGIWKVIELKPSA